MKKILMISVAGMLTTLAVFAGVNSQETTCKAETECCDKSQCCTTNAETASCWFFGCK